MTSNFTPLNWNWAGDSWRLISATCQAGCLRSRGFPLPSAAGHVQEVPDWAQDEAGVSGEIPVGPEEAEEEEPRQERQQVREQGERGEIEAHARGDTRDTGNAPRDVFARLNARGQNYTEKSFTNWHPRHAASETV